MPIFFCFRSRSLQPRRWSGSADGAFIFSRAFHGSDSRGSDRISVSRPRHVSLLTQHHLPLFFTRRDPTRETSNTSSPDPTQPARGFENLLIRPPGRAMTREKRFFLKMAFFWRGWYNGSPQVRSLRKKLLDPSAVACVQTSWKPTVLHLSSSAFVPLADATRFFFFFPPRFVPSPPPPQPRLDLVR